MSEELIKVLAANAAAEFASTYYYYTILRMCSARPLGDLIVETHQQWAMRMHRVVHGLPAPYA